MIHELKIWPQFYCRVADGSKTFELRKNDRGFQPGDEVVLREWDPKLHPSKGTPFGYTDSPPLNFTIGYMIALDSRDVIFSLLPIKPKKARA
jgi:hypothetical protein